MSRESEGLPGDRWVSRFDYPEAGPLWAGGNASYLSADADEGPLHGPIGFVG